MQNIEWAIRQLAVAIDHLMDVVDEEPFSYELIPNSLHHAIVTLMKEIKLVDWESVS